VSAAPPHAVAPVPAQSHAPAQAPARAHAPAQTPTAAHAPSPAPAARAVATPAARTAPTPAAPSTENEWHETEVVSEAPRPRIAGNADAWERFLGALAKTSGSLAETLKSRGKLVDLTNGRALIQLVNLRETERAAALDPQNQRRCAAVFSTVLGTPTTVVIEDQAASRKSRDTYTGKVAELFGGRIEDDA